MTEDRGRRFGGLLVLLSCLLVAVAAEAQNELYVVNRGTGGILPRVPPSVTVYSRTASGDTAPLRKLSGTDTGLSNPFSFALDLTHDELFVLDYFESYVTVYSRTASGDTAPLRKLEGALTGMSSPFGLALDLTHDELFVANATGSVTVYNRTASGNTAPLRTLSGPATGMSHPYGLALDLTHDELFVANANSGASSVTVYSRTASGNTAPLRTLSGAATGVSDPIPVHLLLDLTHDELFVANPAKDPTNSSVTVYSRTASGNTPPLRTLSGPATALSYPFGLALDLTHDELFVATDIGRSVTVYRRTASGNTPPLRTLSGPTTGLIYPLELALVAVNPTVAAVLPLSRSVQVGGAPATAFAAIINPSAAAALNCAPAPPSSPPAGLGPFTYQTTTAANLLTGTPNTPANIAPGATQNYVFGFSPTAAIPQTSLAMRFLCDNTTTAPQTPGVNNFFIVADTAPVPDTIALMATVSSDGVVRIPGLSATQLFAIGTSNVGATGTIVVSGDDGGAGLPLTLMVCETTGGSVCLAPPTPTVTVNYSGGTNRSFAFFAQASGSIPFDPANNRVFARLTQAGVLRGASSAAVCTMPNAGC